MLFNSGLFLFFFLGVYALYICIPLRWQNRLLLLASYVFYGYWDYRFLALIALSTLIDYVAARRIHAARDVNPRLARRWLWLSIAGNLGILGFFKYFNFFADSLASIAAGFGVELSPMTLQIILPVGISFYTFQTLGYTLDVYRGRLKPCRNLPDFALFVAFFPQLMAGPIERARKLIPQLQSVRKIQCDDLRLGVWWIFWGLFQKVFIADNLAPYTFWGTVPGNAEAGLDIYLLSFAFMIRFYCDFSGYSDMARGLALLLGIHLSPNFHLPFFASNPVDFWSRWHMTLTRWFRDNVYGPLRTLNKAAAVVLTMALVGLWHGANLTFIVWGVCWGFALVTYRLVRPSIRRLAASSTAHAQVLTLSGVFLTMHIWLFFGQFFGMHTLDGALHNQWLLLSDLAGTSVHSAKDALTVVFYSAPLVAMQLAQVMHRDILVIGKLPIVVRYFLYLAMLVLLLGDGAETERDFIYFQF